MLIEQSSSAQLTGHCKFQPGPVFSMETSFTAQWLFFQLWKYIKHNFIPHKPCQANWVSAHMALCIYWFLIYSRLLQTGPENWMCHSQWTLKQGENIYSRQSFVLNLRRGKKRPVFTSGGWRSSAPISQICSEWPISMLMRLHKPEPAGEQLTWAALEPASTSGKHIGTSGWEKELKFLFLRVGKSANHQERTSLLRLLR